MTVNGPRTIPEPGTPPHSIVMVDPDDQPAFCPNPQMTLWSSHPRVYLELEKTGEAMCAYCGTIYRLADRGSGKPAA